METTKGLRPESGRPPSPAVLQRPQNRRRAPRPARPRRTSRGARSASSTARLVTSLNVTRETRLPASAPRRCAGRGRSVEGGKVQEKRRAARGRGRFPASGSFSQAGGPPAASQRSQARSQAARHQNTARYHHRYQITRSDKIRSDRTSSSCATCHEIASPSRSGSVASTTAPARAAASCLFGVRLLAFAAGGGQTRRRGV